MFPLKDVAHKGLKMMKTDLKYNPILQITSSVMLYFDHKSQVSQIATMCYA